MAQLFWHITPIRKAAALFFYEPHSELAQLIYHLKYGNRPDIGEDLGRLMANEMQLAGYFDDIDALIPVPLAKKRMRQRGYNQSMQVARGISHITRLPVYDKVVVRQHFTQSQTHQDNVWERRANVNEAFLLVDADKIKGKHLLIIDDIVTTGATVIACGQELSKADNVRLSVLSIGFTKE
jgi:ComF family protein